MPYTDYRTRGSLTQGVWWRWEPTGSASSGSRLTTGKTEYIHSVRTDTGKKSPEAVFSSESQRNIPLDPPAETYPYNLDRALEFFETYSASNVPKYSRLVGEEDMAGFTIRAAKYIWQTRRNTWKWRVKTRNRGLAEAKRRRRNSNRLQVVNPLHHTYKQGVPETLLDSVFTIYTNSTGAVKTVNKGLVTQGGAFPPPSFSNNASDALKGVEAGARQQLLRNLRPLRFQGITFLVELTKTARSFTTLIGKNTDRLVQLLSASRVAEANYKRLRQLQRISKASRKNPRIVGHAPILDSKPPPYVSKGDARRALRAAATEYLNFRFGIMQVSYDIQSFEDALHELVTMRPTTKRSGVSRITTTYPSSDISILANRQRATVANVYEKTVMAYAFARFDPFGKSPIAHRLGVSPASLLRQMWELTTLSFIIDRLVGVGKALEALGNWCALPLNVSDDPYNGLSSIIRQTNTAYPKSITKQNSYETLESKGRTASHQCITQEKFRTSLGALPIFPMWSDYRHTLTSVADHFMLAAERLTRISGEAKVKEKERVRRSRRRRDHYWRSMR